jgi:hypothetical protein
MPLFKSVKKFLTQPACGCKKTRKYKQGKSKRKQGKSKRLQGGYNWGSRNAKHSRSANTRSANTRSANTRSANTRSAYSRGPSVNPKRA